MRCPFCLDAFDVIKKGKDSKGRQRYYCKHCETSFVDRVGERLTGRELRYLADNLLVELNYLWASGEVNTQSRIEHILFQKLPEIPVERGAVEPEGTIVKALAQVLHIGEVEARSILFAAIAEMIRMRSSF